MKAELGVEPWHFEQHANEAVFIPAGCPHQAGGTRQLFPLCIGLSAPLRPRALLDSLSLDTSPEVLCSCFGSLSQCCAGRLTIWSAICAQPTGAWLLVVQVRNLRPCIKVAIDFVSPESVEQCLRLTRHRRALAMAASCTEGQPLVRPSAPAGFLTLTSCTLP